MEFNNSSLQKVTLWWDRVLKNINFNSLEIYQRDPANKKNVFMGTPELQVRTEPVLGILAYSCSDPFPRSPVSGPSTKMGQTVENSTFQATAGGDSFALEHCQSQLGSLWQATCLRNCSPVWSKWCLRWLAGDLTGGFRRWDLGTW